MFRNAFALTMFSVAAFAAETPLLSLVDPAAKVIGGMHVDRTLASPLGRYLLSQMNDSDVEFRKFVDMTGFDPRRDVREVLMATADTSRKNGFVAARGVFNGVRILQAAQSHGGTSTMYNGVQVTTSKNGQWLAILDGSTALMGDQDLVKYAIDHRGGTSAGPTSALAQKAATLASRHDGWLATVGALTPPVTGKTESGPMPTSAMLAGILETSGGIDFGAVVRITAEAVTRSEKDAQALTDVLRFMVTMMRSSAENNPEAQKLEPFLNSLNLTAQASTVKVSFAVPESDLEQMIKPKRSKARSNSPQ
jgi:hypothetical protein